ncbi:MAG: tRNA (adenosine(37)-N6)-threonylcarbamoyltransferase complex dimerization subunit type 1 TsaB [Saprospiraceae bacterium]|nr:tRNA (adenosine(37)-N6)-threonylcarbamoyltransferase complex dimerization subunit type 1 TsaB [Saprospiraceae bacterium]MDW8228361.1 tRNA (adenosine(37)-N6)-threonylcarbamoyltransferase complex dimerization subunit type 1 TsaB [Saprospiraceae bacterium]
MACLLLLETATDVCSVAIALDGEVVALAEETAGVNCAARLTLLIEACVREANLTLRQLDAVAVSGGPGSYTSLRVGISTAKGIGYALDKPLIAVPTLQALAFAAQQHAPTGLTVRYVPMLDARRQEVWMAIFDETLQPLCPAQPLIMDQQWPQHLYALAPTAPPHTLWLCAGNGCSKIPPETLDNHLQKSPVTACSATFLARLAEQRYHSGAWENIAYYEPFYMKPPNITEPKKTLLPGQER